MKWKQIFHTLRQRRKYISRSATVERLSLGDLVILDALANAAQSYNLGMPETPRVGYELLSRFKVTFDFKRQVIVFERP